MSFGLEYRTNVGGRDEGVCIHVYGNDLRGLNRCRYSLDTGKITPFATEKYDNC